jgi:hypothetical protein
MSSAKGVDQLAESDGIPFFERQLPLDDIVLRFLVSLNKNISNCNALCGSMEEQTDRQDHP